MNEFAVCWLVGLERDGYKKMVKVGGDSDAIDLMSFDNSSLFVILVESTTSSILSYTREDSIAYK